MAGLLPGLHTLYLRMQDSRGVWSRAKATALHITHGPNLTEAEFFLDDDPGVGNGEPIDFADGQEFVLFNDASMPPTSPGLHRFYLRCRTTNGHWSESKPVLLRVKSESPSGTEFTAAAETYFDTDPGVGNGIAMYAEDGSFDELEETAYRNVRADTLTLGQHIVYARIRSATGTWSFIVRDTVTIGGPETYRLVSYRADTLGGTVRLTWVNIGATEYRVHYDSTATGSFTSFYSVSAPDTSVVLPTTIGAGRRFYYVAGYWPETARTSDEQHME
ncbi:MAG: hypothetical protein FJY66_01105 [Calditrichaeota bacterium]|nr:hypothetical protein [Calditrichota bacterium]